jgi:DNA-binding MarR family transcriptional regulator
MVQVDHLDSIEQAWKRERPDLDVAPLVLLGRLFRASALANERLGDGLSGRDLRPGWFDLLAALRRTGEPFELNPSQLMSATMLSSGGMTKRLDRLAHAGLVERRPDPDDRRGTLVRLTSRGRAAIEEALPVHLENEERLLARLTLAERGRLDTLLRKLLLDLEGDRPG